jgi:hypothetical protein
MGGEGERDVLLLSAFGAPGPVGSGASNADSEGAMAGDGYEALEKLLDERLVHAVELKRCADGDWVKEFDRAFARLQVVDTLIQMERLTLVRLGLSDVEGVGEARADRHRGKR